VSRHIDRHTLDQSIYLDNYYDVRSNVKLSEKVLLHGVTVWSTIRSTSSCVYRR